VKKLKTNIFSRKILAKPFDPSSPKILSKSLLPSYILFEVRGCEKYVIIIHNCIAKNV
jgi:hypothetical protein